MHIALDGRCMTDRAVAHAYLKEQLSLPEYYGRNLDALHDSLTECGTPVIITVLHKEALEANLGTYGTALLNTFRDAAGKNPALTIIY